MPTELTRSERTWRTWEGWLYLAAVGLTAVATVLMTRLWRADLRRPFYYESDAVGSAAHFKTILETGWYENQPRLGAPFGQRYHDFPFSDDLHPAMAKVLGVFTGDWVVAFNLYYLLTFLLCAAAAVWFFRECGLSGPMTVVLAVLFAVASYHFQRNEVHLFLSGYYMVPLAMVLVLRVIRGEPVWGRRVGVGMLRALFTGRGAGTTLILALLVWSGVYYAVFFGLLLVPAALLAVVRTGDRHRFGGAVAVGAVLLGWFVIAQIPDKLYAMTHGSNADAMVRFTVDAQTYSLRFATLILPPPGHPLELFAKWRASYDSTYPPVSEYPALGLVAALGFLALLGLSLFMIAARRPVLGRPGGRRDTVAHLAALTWIAFLLSTMGGVGSLMSMAVSAIRGWNRMSIVIALLALAGFGILVEAAISRWAERRAGAGQRPTGNGARKRAANEASGRRAGRLITAAAAVVLLVGVADQSVDRAAPDYAATGAAFQSDRDFFQSIERSVAPGSLVFQVPYIDYPESPPLNRMIESDQLRPYMHTETLRWSGGGIKGRPQTTWPGEVTSEPASAMVRDLAIAGFVGIVVDRYGTEDGGRSIEYSLAARTGAGPAFVSADGRWSYFSLAQQVREVEQAMTPQERADAAAAIVRADG